MPQTAHKDGHGAHGSARCTWRQLGGGSWRTAAQSTLHCLTGCVIGEVAGLLIGVTLGFSPWTTIALATGLSYLSGMTLGLLPVMRSQGIGVAAALRIIWVGEVVSIGVMEVVMNLVDYQMGGMTAPSVVQLDVLARHRLRRPGRLHRRLAGQLLAAQARAQGVPLTRPSALDIAGSSAGAYRPTMAALILRVLTLAALALMPFGMGAGAAAAVPQSPAAAVHCGEHGGQPAKQAPDQVAGCTAACSMMIAEPSRVDAVALVAAPATMFAPAKRWTSLPPETATPPPKLS